MEKSKEAKGRAEKKGTKDQGSRNRSRVVNNKDIICGGGLLVFEGKESRKKSATPGHTWRRASLGG